MAPSSCTRRGSQQVDLCPSVFQTTRGVRRSHSICFVPDTPHTPLFILGWRDLTCSVIARRNCCAHSVILGALLWSFSISTVPLFFEMKGSELQPVRCGWNMDFQCGIMTFSFCVPFLIILNTRFACFDGCQAGIFMDLSIIHWRPHFWVVIVNFVRPWLYMWSWDGFFSYVCHFSLCNRWSFSLWWKTVLWFCSKTVMWPVCLMGRYGCPKCWTSLWKF